MTDDSDEPTDDAALAHARARAKRAMEVIVELMNAKKMPRGSATKLAAATQVLKTAGIGALEADQRHTEVLQLLKKRLPKEVYAQVVRAFAEAAGVALDRTSAH